MKKDFEYYTANQKKFVKDHEGKYLVIKNQQLIGAYGTREQAVQEAMKKYQLGTFLVQYVEPGENSISQTFHSRVIFHAS